MNTPTPAQALGELLANMRERVASWDADCDELPKASELSDWIDSLSQHFARLEKELESALACNHGLVRLNEATSARVEASEALLRELREARPLVLHGDYYTAKIAAFLAANGETK